jgi:small-conductance mechanosensitive channel
MPRPQSSKDIASFSECRVEVDKLIAEKKVLQQDNSNLQIITRESKAASEELKKEKRQLVRKMDVISRQQAAAEKLKSTSMTSASAISVVTLLWASFGEYGYPGPAWLFEHEIFYGFVCWSATTIFAWVARSYYEAD